MLNNELPILFKRDSKGKDRFWQVEVELQNGRYRTIAGLVDGKSVTSEWTVVEAKNVGRANETSLADQAMSEAKSAWQKKHDSGYREIWSDVDKGPGFIKPMLAKTYEDYSDKAFDPYSRTGVAYVQPKLDGMRAIVSKDGMQSREGKPIASAPHIFEALKPIFDAHPDIVFDGELYTHKLNANFPAIISLAKKQKPTPEQLAESAAHLQYWVYDLVDPKRTFIERYLHLGLVLEEFLGEPERGITHPSIVRVETWRVFSEAEADEYYAEWVRQGYEGQMVRWSDRGYESGKRSTALLKRKGWQDDEFEIVDVVEGDGNKSGMAATVTVRLPNGSTCGANVNGGNDFARELLQRRDEVIGKLATVKYFHYTPEGSLRFPQMKAVRDYE